MQFLRRRSAGVPQRSQTSRSAPGEFTAQIAEGFSQKTDRHFAHYLHIARGSVNETRAHLSVACGRQYITSDELSGLAARYESLGKQITRLIQHLEREDRKQRG